MKQSHLIHPALRAKAKQQAEQNQAQQVPVKEVPTETPHHPVHKNIFAEKSHQPAPIQEHRISEPTSQDSKPIEQDPLRKFPRPLLVSDESVLEYQHNMTAFEELPKLFYEYTSFDSGNAPCRFARSTCYMVPESSSSLSKSEFKFSVVFTPFAEQTEKEAEIQNSDRREGPIFRCERCRAFVNPGFTYKENYQKYVCNMCELESAVPQNYFDLSTKIESEYPETKYAVYDFIVPDSYRQKDVKRHNMLLCFDMSYESLVNSSFFHVLANVTAILDSLNEDVGIGFILYDTTVSFFRAEEDEDEVSIVRCADPENPASLSHSEMFLNPKKDRSKIDRLLAFLQKFAETRYNQNHNELKASPHCFEILSKSLCEIFKESPGHVLLFSSVNRKQGTGSRALPKSASFRPKESYYTKYGEMLAVLGVTVDMFITAEKQVELSSISALSTCTGGNVYFYNNFRSATDSESLYYDVYRTMTVFRGLDVVCRLRVSNGLQIQDYYSPKGKVHTLDFQLGSLTSDQHVVANLQLGENLKNKKCVYLQFVTLYTNTYGVCLMRITNLSLKITPEMPLFFKNLDCDAYIYTLTRQYGDLLCSKLSNEVSEHALKQAYKLFKYYRYDIGGRYESKEFALPDKIKYFPLYLSSLLSRACFNQKTQVNNDDYNFYSILSLLQLHISKLCFNLYPKIFNLSHLYQEYKLGKSKVGTVGANGYPALPNSIAANLLLIKPEGVYLIDNGLNMYINVRHLTNEELLQDLFGIQSFVQIETPSTLQVIDSEFNGIVHSIINRLRNVKSGPMQPALIIAENDENAYRIRPCFTEDSATFTSNNYWDFLTQLHEKVKED